MSIILQDVTYTYMPGTPFERTAIENVSIEIPSGKITAIAGHTGSGKSTTLYALIDDIYQKYQKNLNG